VEANGETMESSEVIEQLKERHDFERGARWATEEVCAWIVAFETGLLVKYGWHHWWLSVIVGIATFFAFARYFGRREEAAEDAYYRAAELGRYSQASPGAS
jgi:hypothetical protein